VSLARGVAIGFVAGLAVAGGAFFLLRDKLTNAREAARIAELDAHIGQLDRSLSRLAERVAMDRPGPPAPATAQSAAVASIADEHDKPATSQASDIAEADQLVDLGLQSGHWSRRQRDELEAAIADLDVTEQGRIKARIAAAINAGELQMDMRR
jgi:hypothetical protein